MASAPCHEIKFTELTTCVAQCQALLDAYTQALMGGQRVRIMYGNYAVEYQQRSAQDMQALLNLYMTMRNQCPEAMACLPDINPASRVRRGPAIHATMARGPYRR